MKQHFQNKPTQTDTTKYLNTKQGTRHGFKLQMNLAATPTNSRNAMTTTSASTQSNAHPTRWHDTYGEKVQQHSNRK
jgi:hypothetical protein